jgi:hypothetical protein
MATAEGLMSYGPLLTCMARALEYVEILTAKNPPTGRSSNRATRMALLKPCIVPPFMPVASSRAH